VWLILGYFVDALLGSANPFFFFFSYFLVHILEENLSYNLMRLFGYKRGSNFKFFPFARAYFLSNLYLILREQICLL
jgi:hypothetical protein